MREVKRVVRGREERVSDKERERETEGKSVLCERGKECEREEFVREREG